MQRETTASFPNFSATVSIEIILWMIFTYLFSRYHHYFGTQQVFNDTRQQIFAFSYEPNILNAWGIKARPKMWRRDTDIAHILNLWNLSNTASPHHQPRGVAVEWLHPEFIERHSVSLPFRDDDQPWQKPEKSPPKKPWKDWNKNKNVGMERKLWIVVR